MQNINQFYNQLLTPAKAVITMHQKPDGDAMGAALAMYHFLESLEFEVTVISPTNWANFFNWMPGCEKVLDYELNKQLCNDLINKAHIIFCLDFNVLHRTKNMETALTQASAIKILIDHHEFPQIEAFDYGISEPHKSSTCEMVYDFILSAGFIHKINSDIAACLYTGIMTDTGSFRFPSTTASVHRAVAHLKDVGLNHTIIHENIYDNFLENRLRFIGYALLKKMEVLYEYNTALMTIAKKDLLRFEIRTGDTEGLVNYLLTIQGMRFGALVIDRDEERKWSFRSKGNFDVNTFARKHFEGGGHFNAAGGRSSDSLELTAENFKQVIKQYQSQLQ